MLYMLVGFIAPFGQLSAHWKQNMHLPRSMTGTPRPLLPGTFTILIAPAGQSRAQRPQPTHFSRSILCFPLKPSGTSGFSSGYLSVTGLFRAALRSVLRASIIRAGRTLISSSSSLSHLCSKTTSRPC